MNEQRHLTRAGANLIKHFESCMQKVGADQYKAYRCPAGVLTIGYGTTQHDDYKFNANTVWSMAECNEAFTKSMAVYEAAVRRLVAVELEPCQFDALVSFTYNCGEGNLGKSTLLKKVNAKDFDGAAKEFARWNKGGGKVLAGLTRRRASEALLFQGIADDNYDGKPDKVIAPLDEEMPQTVDEPPAE